MTKWLETGCRLGLHDFGDQEKDEAEKNASRATAQAAQQAALQAQQLARQARKAFIEKTRELDAYRKLADAANAVIAMVRASRLDEAEAAARNLLVRYVHDGYDRLGMVYEARGDHKRAAECYR